VALSTISNSKVSVEKKRGGKEKNKGDREYEIVNENHGPCPRSKVALSTMLSV